MTTIDNKSIENIFKTLLGYNFTTNFNDNKFREELLNISYDKSTNNVSLNNTITSNQDISFIIEILNRIIIELNKDTIKYTSNIKIKIIQQIINYLYTNLGDLNLIVLMNFVLEDYSTTSNKYEEKYMKYKTKYLELKELNKF